jgi:UDP-N-acetyl-2-amino-2-deoxyglucuronate dehydrogenase
MNKIKFAVVGCGHIGKRHAAMIMRNSEAELVALCDILPAEKCNLQGFELPFYNDMDTMLREQPTIEVVNICTPNGLHAEQAIQALTAHKHVVVEKPMALNKKDAEAIIYQALQVSRQVFCVMQNRYSPPSQWIKQVISSGVLGKIFVVQLNCYWNRDERYYTKNTWHGSKNLDGGTLFTQFSHFIDILYWLFGDITNINARFADFNHQTLTDFEDTGFVSFDFINGGMGVLNYSTAVFSENMESSMTIIAENGSVKIGGQYMDKVEYCNIKNYTMPPLSPTNPSNDYGAYKGSAQNHHLLIDNVINVLKHRDSITTNALEGLKTVEIIQRIYSKHN